MRRNQGFKGFICGFLTATVLMISIPALAETIQAKFNALNIKINGVSTVKAGENFTLPDGRKVPYTIVYNDTTYLPLRETVRLVGKELLFDGTTSTADIVDKPTSTETPKTGGNVVSEQKYVTMAELAHFLVKSLDLKDNGKKLTFSYKDVPETHEFYNDIMIAAKHDILLGDLAYNFYPDKLVDRKTYAFALCNALNINIYDYEKKNISIKDMDSYTSGSLRYFAAKAVIDLGLMQLDENCNFNPNDYILSPLTPNPDLKNYMQK